MNAVQTIERTIETLDIYTWVPGHFAGVKSWDGDFRSLGRDEVMLPEANCFCLIGAMQRTNGLGPNMDGYTRAVEILADSLELPPLEEDHNEEFMLAWERKERQLMYWNDSPDRNEGEVTDALRAGLKLAKLHAARN